MHLVLSCAQLETTGLMVCSDHDEGLVRMLGHESKNDVDGVGEVIDLHEGGGGVIGVSAVVDPSTLNHEEETLVAEAGVQVTDTCVDEIGKLGIIILTVDRIRKLGLGLAAEAENTAGNGLDILELVRTVQDLDARSTGLGLEECCIVAGVPLGDEASAGREIYRGVEVLEGDILIVAALGGMGGEACRGGVVYTHAGGYARAVSRSLGPFHDIRYGIAVYVDSDGVVVGLHARSEGCASGRGVGHERGRGHRRDEIPHREMGEVDRGGAVAGTGIVLLGADHLVDTHAVTYHVEDILDLGGIGLFPVAAGIRRDDGCD